MAQKSAYRVRFGIMWGGGNGKLGSPCQDQGDEESFFEEINADRWLGVFSNEFTKRSTWKIKGWEEEMLFWRDWEKMSVLGASCRRYVTIAAWSSFFKGNVDWEKRSILRCGYTKEPSCEPSHGTNVYWFVCIANIRANL